MSGVRETLASRHLLGQLEGSFSALDFAGPALKAGFGVNDVRLLRPTVASNLEDVGV